MKLKCSITPTRPYVHGNWHSCQWTESTPDNIHRTCVTKYPTDSTREFTTTCQESKENNLLNTTILKKLRVYGTGEHTCILEIQPLNHLFNDDWTTWACTFVECETPECLQANGCTARAKLKVFVSNKTP